MTIEARALKPNRKEVLSAACRGDLDLLRELVAQGAALNEVAPNGESLFQYILFELCADENPSRYEIARTLLALGADPNVLDQEGTGTALTPAMYTMDTELLRILLEAGADPNKPRWAAMDQSFYDLALFDYIVSSWPLGRSSRASDDEKRDPDKFLQYLDRMAAERGDRRPDHLLLLREYGARSAFE